MKTENNMTVAKRIAIIASADKRKELIEWSYFNKDVLEKHELIASHSNARVLEGTVHKPVYELSEEKGDAYHQLVLMMKENKVDLIFFFDNPMRTYRPDDIVRKLLDMALEMNIVIAGERTALDFMRA
jgi:methylglyoxal synthase